MIIYEIIVYLLVIVQKNSIRLLCRRYHCLQNNTNLLRDEAVDKERSFDFNITCILSPLGSGSVAIDIKSQLFLIRDIPGWNLVPETDYCTYRFFLPPFSALTDKYRRTDLNVGRFCFFPFVNNCSVYVRSIKSELLIAKPENLGCTFPLITKKGKAVP